MASNPGLEQFRSLTVAAVTGLLEVLGEEPGAVPTSVLALERLGDLLRARSTVPPALRAWSRDLSEAVLAHCLSAIEHEASEWRLPRGVIARGDDESADAGDVGLDLVVQRRDEVESFVLAVRGVLLERGRSPVEVPHWSALQATLAQVDEQLAATTTPASVQELLGLRRCLVDRHSWVNRLHVSLGEDASSAPALARVHHLPFGKASLLDVPLPLDLGEPDDQAVYNYLDNGALYRYVEGYAAANPEFAEQLAATFDALNEEGELSDAIIPRRWRRDYAGKCADAVGYSVPLNLAAADDGQKAHRVNLKLGPLPGLTAETDAGLSLSAGQWTLRVEVSNGTLTRVQMNERVATQANANGSWLLTVEASGGDANEPVRLRVEDADGSVFEETIAARLGSS